MKTKRRQGVEDAEGQRLNVRIDPEAYQRLQIHCVMSSLTPGRLIEKLVNDHCRDWKVQANRPAQARPIPDTEMIGEAMTAA